MKINEVEAAVGITKKNIRFYEEEGLLQPRRDAGNGYRDYAPQDVERLQRIKLLRKLDVPLAEIRQMLDGQLSLSDGMRRHMQELQVRQSSLAEAMEFCRVLGEKPSMDDLDVSEALNTLEKRERQGVRFVNVQKVDRKTQRYQGAVLGAGIFIAMMAFIIAFVVWACMEDPAGAPPAPLVALLIGIPAICIICVLVVLYQRFKEIQGGEEDAYRNY
ncbi:MAG: MerR family transcriptional regulator [Faecalibacterium sp.]|nr:MerR family transcriptional regulator [Faecalibacterium sp.]